MSGFGLGPFGEGPFGEGVEGVPLPSTGFPHDPLDLHVEMFLLGAWVSMDNRLMDQTISPTFGRADETSISAPATVSLLLKNDDGKLTPTDPRSIWWPDVDIGTQLRIRVGTIVMFWGKVADIAPTWPVGDLSDNDDPGFAFVTVTAAGPLRRRGQGKKALHSPLWRLVTSQAVHVTNYWPLEAKAARSLPAVGIGPMVLRGFALSSDTTLPGSEPLPSCSSGFCDWHAALQGPLGSWAVELPFHLPQAPEVGTNALLMNVHTSGSVEHWRAEVFFDSVDGVPKLNLTAYHANGTNLVNTTGANPSMFGEWKFLRLAVAESGGNVAYSLIWTDVETGDSGSMSGSVVGTAGAPVDLSGRSDAVPQGGLSIGHLVCHDRRPAGWLAAAAQGYLGEKAGLRMLRLATEEGESLVMVGDPNATMQMGPQTARPLMDLWQECANTDGGLLGEDRPSLALRYLTRVHRYNAPVVLTLDAATSQVSPPFAPVYDDQALRNDVTAKNTDGSEYEAIDQVSIDRADKYDEQVDVNLATQSEIAHAAGWHLHLGTWPGLRTPDFTINLADHPTLIPAWLGLNQGDRLRIINLPPQFVRDLWDPAIPMGSVDLIFQGGNDDISAFDWKAHANCTPAGPWTVAVVEDGTWGRGDTDESRLGEPIDATDTTFEVDVIHGPRWIDSAEFGGQFPFAVRIDGEVMTVNAITGTGTTQAWTVIRSVNGVSKSHAAGVRVALAYPAILAR